MTGLTNSMLNDPRLLAVSNGQKPIGYGEQGPAVARLQLALIAMGQPLPRSTQKQSKLPDATFGAETLQGVRQYQESARLKIDGVVGKQTLASLDRALPKFERRTACCSNGNAAQSSQSVLRAGANFRAAFASPLSIGGITLPTGVRFLTAAQQATAVAVFGSSLDFTRIVLSDATGASSRPFTVAIPIIANISIVVINAGTFSPSRNLLIHELTHAWQSQHHPIATQFMINSVESQLLADEIISRFGADASAYYYRPGRSFALYGAEQAACQVEGGISAAVALVRASTANVPNALNVLGLATPHWELRGPGVVTSC